MGGQVVCLWAERAVKQKKKKKRTGSLKNLQTMKIENLNMIPNIETQELAV